MQRPVRSTRGVRSSPLTQTQIQAENAMYSQLFGAEQSSDSSLNPHDMFPTMSKSQKAQLNCQQFPYARSIHYFYNLLMYPRIKSPSYVQQIYPHGTFHDDKLNKIYNTKNLINRKYIGLPQRLPSVHTKDKNDCHEFLFRNEDKKWRLDQQLCELKYIQKHPSVLNQAKCKNYFYLKRDIELAMLYQPDVPIEQKLILLNSKIEVLEQRKKKQYDEIFAEDQFFYHVSLNQQFFNQKQIQQSNFDIQHIIVQAICSSVLTFSQSPDNDQLQKQIQTRFSIFSTVKRQDQQTIKHPMYKTECYKYINESRYESHFLPSYLFGFGDQKRLEWVGQVIGVRIMEKIGVQGFDLFKRVWEKFFEHELVLPDQFSKVERWEYIQAIKSLLLLSHSPTVTHTSLPTLPTPNLQHPNYFQQSPSPPILTIKQYLILYMIYYLYQRASFMKLDYRLVGSALFDKYQYVLLGKLGQRVINFEMCLKKVAEVVGENIEERQVPVFIRGEWIKQEGLMMVWVEGQEVEEGEIQGEGEEGEGEGDEVEGQQEEQGLEGEEEEEIDDEEEQDQEQGQDEDDEDQDQDQDDSPPPPPQGSLGQFPSKRRRFT